jgi:hypothetical protein
MEGTGTHLNKGWNRPLIFGLALIVIGFTVFAFWQEWEGVSLNLQIGDLLTKMSPLILASAFIERAVEILVSPWRDTEAAKLAGAITAIKNRVVDASDPTAVLQLAKNTADLQVASAALDEYRGQTQRYAFSVNLVLSFCAAAVGVRALFPFLDVAGFHKSASVMQQAYFRNYDVLITTALLAGGADGLHSIINSITSFFPKPSGGSN